MVVGKMERDSMVFYRSFFESVEDLDAEEFKECVCTILRYGLDGVEEEVSGIAKTVFKLAKPQIDKNNQRYINGLKGGKPKANQTETKPNQNVTKANQTVTKPKPNVNVNVNDNVNDLLSSSTLSDSVKDKARDWINYKKERRETYKDTGLRSLLTQISNKEKEFGSKAVVDVIDLSMSNGWKGIIWDRMPKNTPTMTPNTTFHNFDNKHNYDFDEMENMLLR